MKEEWRPIEGYDGLYEISNFGRVRSSHTRGKKRNIDNVLKNNLINGYYSVVLHKNKCRKWSNIHRLVAKAFLPNPHNYPEVNHIDENKLNNRVDNLEWVSHRYNILYSRNIYKAIQKNEIKPIIVHRKDGSLVGSFESIKTAAVALNCDTGHISKCCKHYKGYKSHKGYIFEYRDKSNN